MSLEARIQEFNNTSYPYKWISGYLGINYWIILNYREDTPTGFAARETVYNHHISDEIELRQWLDRAEKRRKGR